MRIRIRGPSGVKTIEVEESATIRSLLDLIASTTGVLSYDVKLGFPPQPLDLAKYDQSLPIEQTDLKLSGEQLIVVPRTSPPPAELASETSPAAPLTLTRTTKVNEDDPPELPVPTHGATMVLRVMPDDNSCLFRAFGTAVSAQANTSSNLDSMRELRTLIAQGILANDELYNEAVLQKNPEEYCEWIQNTDSWGGAIELAILSQAFDVEICSINVQDLRIDRFNEVTEGSEGRKRVILVYSGIHYDVIALSPSEPPHDKSDLPAELDTLLFDTWDDIILDIARELCGTLRKRHYYTDTSNFSVKCNVCGWLGKGEKEAVEHANTTSHTDFGEAG